MRQEINSKYLQCKEAYLDGFREGFSRAYHLNNRDKSHEDHKDSFSVDIHITLTIEEAVAKDRDKE